MALNDRKFSSLVEHNKSAAENNINTAYGQIGSGQYNLVAPTLADGDFGFLQFTSDNKLKVDAVIETGDIEIGAVEIKNATTDDRVIVKAGNTFVASDLAMGVSIGSAVPESGTDAVGADAYATVLTPSTTFKHISISNEGANPATVSIDGGTTDTFIRIAGNSIQTFDGVSITATAIQAKNASAGSNYANLTIQVW